MKHEVCNNSRFLETIPRILYWKWDEKIFDDGVLENKISDILNRSDFDLIYVSFHWIKVPFTDIRIKNCVTKATELFHKAGKLFVLDVDVRNEAKEYFEKYPEKSAGFIWVEDAILDDNGCAQIKIFPKKVVRWWNIQYREPSDIISAVAFDIKEGDMSFDSSSVTDISKKITTHYEKFDNNVDTNLENLGVSEDDLIISDQCLVIDIDCGVEFAGKTVALIPYVKHVCPDFFSSEMYEHYIYMFESIKDIDLDGIGVDEWGYSLSIDGWNKNGGLHMPTIPYSYGMRDRFSEKYGEDLDEQLIYLFYFDNDNDSKNIYTINKYIENFRQQNAENEEFIYNTSKKYFGEKTFIAAHPTWNGAEVDFSLETYYNGLDWWEVKRDYAQTDETVLIPIRSAMARKAGGQVWFNMFYQQSTDVVDLHIPQTWRNIKYGGRQHQLGYECPREGILEFVNPTLLEIISSMEGRIKKLNEIQTAAPDSRVLCVFGYENATNWIEKEHIKNYWTNWNENLVLSMNVAKWMFELGYFFDLVPTYEIDNGSVRLENGKIVYGPNNHTYDAIVLVNANYYKKSTFEFLYNYANQGGNVITCCEVLKYNDGSLADLDFAKLKEKAFNSYEISYSVLGKDMFECYDILSDIGKQYAEEIVNDLKQLQISTSKYSDGCLLTDGMALFSLENADKAIGNNLKISEYVNGHLVEFDGEDYLAIRLKDDSTIDKITYGKVNSLCINGNKII